MEKLLVQLRCMQLYNHAAHNLVGRMPFGADHELFKEFYTELDGDYDDAAERMIGLGMGNLDMIKQTTDIAIKFKSYPTMDIPQNNVFFQNSLKLEEELCSLVKQIILAGVSEGTKQLLGDICNHSEVRQYKQKQRLKR